MNYLNKVVGEAYTDYQAKSLPWNSLHDYSLKLATSPTAANNAMGTAEESRTNGQAFWRPSRARKYAYRAAVLPHALMRLPDIIVGTGSVSNPQRRSFATLKDATDTIFEGIKNPFACGIIGMSHAVQMLGATLMGAWIGSVIAAAWPWHKHEAEACQNFLAAYSFVTASFAIVPQLIGIGALRLVTGVAKFALVGAAFGAGYAAGFVVDNLIGATHRRAPRFFPA